MRAGKARQLSEEEAKEADFARLQRWDAEIEAEFQRVVAATKTAGRKKRGQRLVGFPFAFLADVCRLTEGRATLVVAELIYRRTRVCSSRTVTLPGAELVELGVTRPQKFKAGKPRSSLYSYSLFSLENADEGLGPPAHLFAASGSGAGANLPSSCGRSRSMLPVVAN